VNVAVFPTVSVLVRKTVPRTSIPERTASLPCIAFLLDTPVTKLKVGLLPKIDPPGSKERRG
jgi:hypothetical protein